MKKRKVIKYIIIAIIFVTTATYSTLFIIKATKESRETNKLIKTLPESGVIITPIHSLKLNSEIRGNFTLGTGYIREQKTYHYYRGDSINGYILDYLPAYKTKIFYTDEKPHIKTDVKYKYRTIFNNEIDTLIFIQEHKLYTKR